MKDIGREIVLRFQRKYSSPPCFKCGSENTVVQRFDTGHGSREYFCKDCRRRFSERIDPKPKPSMRKVAKTKPKPEPIQVKKVTQIPLPKTVTKPLCSSCGKPVCICKMLEEKKRFTEKLNREAVFQKNMKSALSLDSVKNVPCFSCLEQNRRCVETCGDLEIFLMGELNRD